MSAIAVPSISPRDPNAVRWTRNEYYRMVEAGLFDGRRVQLIGGEIIELAPQKNDHMVAIGLAQQIFTRIFGEGYWVRIQGPVQGGKWSEPEPDVAVVRGSPRDFKDHP